MDPLVIGGVLLVILVFALLLAYFLFYSEQSFEDALASQKANSDILVQSKVSSGKTGLKNRKKPKKERTKSEGESGQEKTEKQKSSEHLIEASDENDPAVLSQSLAEEAAILFETTPEKPTIAESSEEEKVTQKPKKKMKDKKKSDRARGNLTPKEQEPSTRAVHEDVVVQENFQKTEAEPVLEGLPPMVDEEPVLPKDELNIPVVNTSKKTKKSKAPKERNLNADSLNLKSITDTLEVTNFSHNDIQKLVDILLDKQKSAEQWKTPGGKPDPIDALRKQLSEKESAFLEEQKRAEGLAVKVKELREEIIQERTKQKNIDVSMGQKIKSLEKENEALQMRMTVTQKNNALENEKLVAALENCKKNQNQTDWHQLQEELASGKEFVRQLESKKVDLEARIGILEKDVNSRKENEGILKQQAAEANDRIKNFDAVKNSLTQQLMQTVKAKSESEHRLELVKKEAESAHSEKSDAVQKAGVLQSQLDEERSKKSELEKMFKTLELKLKDASDKHVEEKELLVKQLESSGKKMDETQLAELQKKFDIDSRELEELKAKLAQSEVEHGRTKETLASREEQLNKHEGELNSLKSSNNSKDEEIETLKKTLMERESEMIIMKNNVVQNLESTPEVDDEKVKTFEEEIATLKSQLEEKKERITYLEKSTDTMKTKNNELREKNWKAMDALSNAEKHHKADIGKAVSSVKEENKKNLESLHSEIKEFLCRLRPGLSVDKDLSFEIFIKEYENESVELDRSTSKSDSNDSKVGELEEELKKYKQKTEELSEELNALSKKNEELAAECGDLKSTVGTNDGELKGLLEKNKELTAQCDKYKSTLGSTENLLHELEDNVEKEMACLKVSVESKDSEIKKANESVNELTAKLKEARDELLSKDNQISSLQLELSNKNGLDDKASELKQEELNALLKKNEELAAECEDLKSTVETNAGELKRLLEKNEELAAQCDKYKSTLDSTENLLEKEVASLKVSVESKDSEIKKASESVNELTEKLKEAKDELLSKDNQISSLQQELSNKNGLDDKASELEQMTATVAELKENLKKADEDSKSKDSKISSLETDVLNKANELKQVTTGIAELEENLRKTTDETTSKDVTITGLEQQISALKASAESSSEVSKTELKNMSDEIERLKGQEKTLREELAAVKKEAAESREENRSPELEKYKNDASEAAKVNAELRKEVEEVRLLCDQLKSDEGKEAKVKALEEKLNEANERENELLAKIAHMEDSKSTASYDEEPGSPDSKEKKKKGFKGFSLMGSKSKKESKYKEFSEKIDHLKSESDEKTTRIAELEAKLKESETALQAQEGKVQELSDKLKKAQDSGIANGGLQNSSKPLSETQMKQMAEAMKDGEPTGAV